MVRLSNPIDHKQDFEDNGFTFYPKLFSSAEMTELAESIKDAQSRAEGSPLDRSGLTFKNNLYLRSEGLRRFISSQKIVDTLRQIIGPDFWCRWDQTVDKQPGGDEFPWHQDNGYNGLVDGHLQFWIALTEMTEENGGLWLQRGSHRHGLLPHHPTDNHLACPGNEADAVFVAAEPGDALAFSSFTLHRTEKNTTDKPRTAYVIEYMSCEHFDPYIQAPYFIVSEGGRSNPHFARFYKGRMSLRNQIKYLGPRIHRAAHQARVALAEMIKGPRPSGGNGTSRNRGKSDSGRDAR